MNAKIKAAAEIIKTTALEAVAKKNGVTVADVVAALNKGNEGAVRQFAQFLKAGMDSALAMADAGEISLA